MFNINALEPISRILQGCQIMYRQWPNSPKYQELYWTMFLFDKIYLKKLKLEVLLEHNILVILMLFR